MEAELALFLVIPEEEYRVVRGVQEGGLEALWLWSWGRCGQWLGRGRVLAAGKVYLVQHAIIHLLNNSQN